MQLQNAYNLLKIQSFFYSWVGSFLFFGCATKVCSTLAPYELSPGSAPPRRAHTCVCVYVCLIIGASGLLAFYKKTSVNLKCGPFNFFHFILLFSFLFYPFSGSLCFFFFFFVLSLYSWVIIHSTHTTTLPTCPPPPRLSSFLSFQLLPHRTDPPPMLLFPIFLCCFASLLLCCMCAWCVFVHLPPEESAPPPPPLFTGLPSLSECVVVFLSLVPLFRCIFLPLLCCSGSRSVWLQHNLARRATRFRCGFPVDGQFWFDCWLSCLSYQKLPKKFVKFALNSAEMSVFPGSTIRKWPRCSRSSSSKRSIRVSFNHNPFAVLYSGVAQTLLPIGPFDIQTGGREGALLLLAFSLPDPRHYCYFGCWLAHSAQKKKTESKTTKTTTVGTKKSRIQWNKRNVLCLGFPPKESNMQRWPAE